MQHSTSPRWLKGALILPDRIVEHGLVQIDGDPAAGARGRVGGIWDLEAEAAPAWDPRETIALEKGYLAPGFIDLHVHGGGGADFMDADPEAVATVTSTHARYGTTGLLATTLTAPEERLIACFRAARQAPRRGATILGFHVEGPFINPKMKGAQDERYVRPGTVAEVERWLAEGRPEDRWHVTLAPEIEGHLEVIRHLAGRGVVVSAGHTDCTYAQLQAAAGAGLRHVTHLYNAMRGLHHREPGTVGGALTLPGVTVEVIADGVHSHPATLTLAVRTRGPQELLLITDAMRATGMPDGTYMLGDLPARVENGRAMLANGTLAGSVLTMDAAVRNMVRFAGVSLPEAVAMASCNPARLHGLGARKGTLAAGMDADLVLLDQDLHVLTTIVGGQIQYDRR